MRYFTLDGREEGVMLRCIAGEMLNLEAGKTLFELGVETDKSRSYPIIKNKYCKLIPMLNMGVIYTTLTPQILVIKLIDVINQMEPVGHMADSLLYTNSNLFCASHVTNLSIGTNTSTRTKRTITSSSSITQYLKKSRFTWKIMDITKMYDITDKALIVSSIVYDTTNYQTKNNNHFTMKLPEKIHISAYKKSIVLNVKNTTIYWGTICNSNMSYINNFTTLYLWYILTDTSGQSLILDKQFHFRGYVQSNLYTVDWDDISSYLENTKKCSVCSEIPFSDVFIRFAVYTFEKKIMTATEEKGHIICNHCIWKCKFTVGPILQTIHPNNPSKIIGTKYKLDKKTKLLYKALFKKKLELYQNSRYVRIYDDDDDDTVYIIVFCNTIPHIEDNEILVLFS